MSIQVLMPALSPTMTEGNLARWLKKEGDAGRRKINQYTRYFTVVLATVQAFAMSASLTAYAYGAEAGLGYYFTCIVSLVTGAVFMMWLGEQVTERGIGNGISMLIFAGIVAGMPSAIVQAVESARQGDLNILALLLVVVLALAVIWIVIRIERGQRRITVNYAKRQPGRQGSLRRWRESERRRSSFHPR